MKKNQSIALKSPTVMLIGIVLTASVLCAGAALAESKPDSKIDQQLLDVADPAFGEQPPTSGQLIAQPLPIRVRDGQVLIDALADSDGAALAADLAALGAENVTSYGKTVSAWLPTDAIEQLNALKSLRFARPSYAVTRFFGSGTSTTGLTTSQGDPAMFADLARLWYGVDGSGIKVGVLSNTFDNSFFALATDYADDVANGDLPAGVEVLKEGPVSSSSAADE